MNIEFTAVGLIGAWFLAVAVCLIGRATGRSVFGRGVMALIVGGLGLVLGIAVIPLPLAFAFEILWVPLSEETLSQIQIACGAVCAGWFANEGWRDGSA